MVSTVSLGFLCYVFISGQIKSLNSTVTRRKPDEKASGFRIVRISNRLDFRRPGCSKSSGFQTSESFEIRTFSSGFQTYSIVQTSDNRTLYPVFRRYIYIVARPFGNNVCALSKQRALSPPLSGYSYSHDLF